MATLKVIDVSHWNGSINWSTVAKNVDAVIIRAGYRGYGSAGTLATDPKFRANIQGAIAAKIPVGVYWCTQALSDAEAVAEAKYCAELLKGFEIRYPVYLDSEHMGPNATGRADKISKTRRTQYGLTFCRAMKEYGYKTGLYCSESWYAAEIDGGAFDNAGYDIWIAKYSSNKPKYACDAWQYSDKGKISGISGNVDLNHFYKDYSKQSDYEIVQKRFGFTDGTMEYLASYKHGTSLLKKLATAK
jgi:GH25 family lysozyme M1 (1,4-beta-N-acetylmuramidase)